MEDGAKDRWENAVSIPDPKQLRSLALMLEAVVATRPDAIKEAQADIESHRRRERPEPEYENPKSTGTLTIEDAKKAMDFATEYEVGVDPFTEDTKRSDVTALAADLEYSVPLRMDECATALMSALIGDFSSATDGIQELIEKHCREAFMRGVVEGMQLGQDRYAPKMPPIFPGEDD